MVRREVESDQTDASANRLASYCAELHGRPSRLGQTHKIGKEPVRFQLNQPGTFCATPYTSSHQLSLELGPFAARPARGSDVSASLPFGRRAGGLWLGGVRVRSQQRIRGRLSRGIHKGRLVSLKRLGPTHSLVALFR
mmetsp:Transcript_6442/g.16449  ORF Transcript_6442/g.16449 Transcript_6442/m.16449 type:complete len:138 (+) Transcript_6442:1633-2046(+)